jgi:hypothetical protein
VYFDGTGGAGLTGTGAVGGSMILAMARLISVLLLISVFPPDVFLGLPASDSAGTSPVDGYIFLCTNPVSLAAASTGTRTGCR